MADKRTRMELMVSKWGNSLAVRLPAKSAKRLGVARAIRSLRKSRLTDGWSSALKGVLWTRPRHAACVNFFAVRKRRRQWWERCAAARATDDLHRYQRLGPGAVIIWIESSGERLAISE
jgi:hypothetical protein